MIIMVEDREPDNPDRSTNQDRASAQADIKIDPGETVKKYDLDKEFPEFTGWEAIGFHRGLGREFWQVMIELITTSLDIFIISLLLPILAPFPEVGGYQGIAGGIYALVYTAFDVGTNFGLNRFIAEYRIKNVKKMLQFISFTIWWQSFTGLIQVTILSIFTFQVIVNSNFAYLAWILLLGLQKQYPGWLGVFRSTLEGMQHLGKVEVLRFLQGQVVERILTIGFVLYFRWVGETNVNIGLLMGVIIGNVIGSYIDDFIFEAIAAYYLHGILKKYFGLSIRDCFTLHYDRDVMREIIFYSLQGSALPFLSSFVGTYTFFTYVGNINAYAYWSTIIGRGIAFAGQIRQFGDFSLSTAIAESYMSEKKTLSEFYISSSVKWRYMFMIMIAFIILAILPYFYIVIRELGAFKYYIGAENFIIAGVFIRLAWPFVEIPDAVMWGTKKITQFNIIRVCEELGKLLNTWFFVVFLRVHETWGTFGLLFLIGFSQWIPIWIKTAACYIYIQKRVLNIKIYWRSTIIIPAIAALPNILITQLWYYTGFFPLKAAIGMEATIAISIAVLFFVVIFTYFPLTALLGGFDEYQLFTLKKAIDLSGPSKPIFKIVEKLVIKSAKISRKVGVFGRYPIPHEEAHKEIRELMEIKRFELNKNKRK